ncbi:helix-turn-helix transcriptional regulator [Corynebacterium tuberculostearicum]|uniref:helix-turn-helix transcriptional regulator n=1 Tax=Corynebacterium tuberculostearicum TaxID=38304 RepID=UPI0020275819|nr:helix-turn-helix domain-containing protein [Corynebacterium tuberculostearicum]MCG7454518.1 helix-turn-helix domain-containing protein [Corynebacterium tuberculostearicum]
MTLPSTPTIPLPEAAKLLGIGKSTAYAAVRKGKFPVRVIQIGNRYVVPTAPLLELFGLDELPDLEGSAA